MPENTLPEIGKIIAVNGEAYAESSAGLRPLEAGSPVFEGEELVTSSGSNLEVRFADDTLLSQGSDSRISLDDYAFDPSGDTASDYFVKITEGTFRMVTGKIAEQNPERFQVGSPLATIGIRGTTTIHEVRPGQGEKHGVEEIHSGKALIVQSVDGQIRQIAQSQGIVDVASSGALSPVRSLSTQELNSFREIAPASIQHEQEIRQDRKEEEEEEKQDTKDTEENAEESQEESENNDESEEGETTDGEGAEGEAAEGESVEGEGAEGESTEGEPVEGEGTEGEAAEQEDGQEEAAEADGPQSEAEAEAEAEETGRPQEGENPAQADNNAEENANAEQPPEDGVPVETAQDQSGETQISQETGTTENNGPDGASETGGSADEGNSPGTGSSPDAGLGGAGGETQGPIVADMGTGEGSGPENGMQTPGDPEGLPSDINPGGGDSEGNIGSVIDPGRGIVSGGESGALANQKDYDSSKVKGETQKIGDENKPDNDDSSPAEGGPEVGGETSGGDQQDEGGESEGSTTGDTIGGTTGTGLDALAGTGGLPGTTNDFSSPTSVTPVNPTGTGTTPAPSTSDDEDLLPEDTGTGTDTTPEPDQGDTSGSSEPVDPIIYGTAGNDYLPGTSASDTISALPGDDILEGMAGDDTLQGGDGIDLTSYISSDSGVEVDLESGTSSGGQGNDSLVSIEGVVGSNHNDTLTGSLSADNTFEGGFGEDYIDGKGGTNTASYRFADGAEVNLASETASATHEDGYITYESTLKNISNLIGSEGSDSFTGDSGANTFYDIDGAFSDSYDGSGGTDTLSYRLLEGGTGVNTAGNNVTAGAGDDSFTGIEKIEGSQYADTLTGGTGVSTLSGYMGDDTLTGTPGAGMVLSGDYGNDTIISGQNSNSISGGNDVDLLKYDTSGTVVINTNSAPGEGTATHENGTDTFTEIESYLTGSGDDTFIGSMDNETFNGTGGTDTIDYSAATLGVNVSLDTTAVQNTGQGFDALLNIEKVSGSAHADTLTASSAGSTLGGNAGADIFYGKAGNDSLDGGDDNDTFYGSTGTDSIAGGGGDDIISYRNLDGGTGINVDIFSGGDGIVSGGANGEYNSIEILEGSQYDDVFDGQSGHTSNITIFGYDGNDYLDAEAGNDYVDGGKGNDTFFGGRGSDSIIGGEGLDLLQHTETSTPVILNTDAGTATHTTGTDTFKEIESYQLSDLNDTIIGSSADETFDGGVGTDTISYSGAGSGVTVDLSDTVAQSTGQGTDTLLNIENVEGSGQADTITAATNGSTLSGNGGNDTLTGLGGNDLLYGISGNNVLNGGAGDDSIVGADGDDTITGGAGNDVLDGGAGNDTFVFSELGGTSVVAEAINNFSSADDTLEFSGTNYSQSAGFGTYAGTYSGESANIGTDPAFVLDTFGHLWYDENGDASGGHHFITREMGASVTAADITVDGAAIDGVGLTQTGTSAAETFTGSTGNDYFSGMGGNDVFYDGAGDDSISGGTGDDFIYAGYGNDSYDGGDGLDTVSFETSAGGVVFSLGGAAASGSSPDKITAHFEAVKGSDHGDSLFGGDGDSTLFGGDGNDFLQSFGGNDTIKDGAGDDTVYAGDGNDFIFAGDGFDTYDGGDGIDTLSFEDSSAGVTGSFGISSNSSGSKTSTNFEVIKGSAYADNLTSSVALSLFGLDGNDTITGSLGSDALLSGDAGDDSITGDWGDDTIWGGEGADTLDGGSGQDVFIYSSLGTATVTGEQINNFSAADDKIYFKTTLYDPSASFSSFGGDYDGEDGVFGNTQPGFVFDASNRLWYDDNGDSAGGLHFVANISGDAVTGTNLILDPEMTQFGTAGDDTISGSIGNDFLSGLGGNDTLYGHAGSDSLIGGAGNDYIVPGSGFDVIDGGEGFDTLSFEDLTEGIIFSLNVGGGVGGDIIASNSSSPGGIIASNADVRKTATSFEKLKGTAYDDKLGAGLTAGTLFGLDGNDQLYGSDENDYLSGDDGNDSIFGGDGDDTIIGGAGEDHLDGGAGNDTFHYVRLGTSTATAERINSFSSTDDTINFSSTNYNQASGFETYAGSYAGSATILGAGPGFVFDADGKLWYDDNGNTAGGQHFVANINGDTVTADDITVDGAAIEGAGMTETGTSGDDTLSGGTGNDTISGLAGDDTIYGAAGNDTIYGGEDSDWINGGVGSNYLDGGGGERDGLSYQASDSGITMSVSDNSVTHGTTPGVDTITGFEGYEGSSHDDTITGSSNNERFFASTGNDTYDGNGGRDALTYEKIGSSIQVDLTAGTATGASGNDSFSNFNYIIGTDQADTITATSGDMLDYTVEGGKGDDILTGGDLPTDKLVYINAEGSVTVNLSDGTSTGADGNDTISGFGVVEGSMHDDHITGDGNMNQLRGNAGDDTLDGGGGDDMVDYMQASAGVYVNLADGTATGGDGNDTLLNFENVIGSTDYNDTIIGNSGDNHFTDHGETDDTYIGNGGTDAVYYQNLSSGITVDLVAGTVTGGSGSDKLFDIEAVYGSSHNDIITGGALLSTLSGGEGNDIITAGSGGANITGGIGDDTLIAGSGSDKFFYNSSSEIGDTISGFDSGTDSLEFDLGSFDSTALFKTVTATYDGSNGTIGSTDSTFVYDSANHQLWYDSNGDDAGGEELIATFDGDDHVQVDDIHVNGSALNPTATTINGTSGKDDIIATSADNVIYGKEESDEIFGMEGDDTIYGELGEDVLSGGLGNDYLNGGTSDGDVDRLLYYNAPSGVNVNLADGTTTGGDGNDTFVEIEGVIGSKFADTLTGDGNDNIFWITEGDDTIDGAAGTDMISYEIASGSVTVNLGDGTATGAMGNDIFSGIENVEGSKNYTDYITGSSGDNVFYDDASTDSYQGGAGTDTISFEGLDSGVAANLTNSFAGGGAGGDIIGGMENIIGSRYDDTITGDSGNNKFWGLEGNDTIDGAGGIDAISYEKSGSVTVNLATSVATGSNGTDTLSNIENVIGSDYGDTITGDSGDNVFRDGGATAADSYDGEDGTDTLHYKDMAVKITADFQSGTVDMDSGPTDNFSNIEIILGTAYDDTFVSGNITDDTMHGEAGNDILSFINATSGVNINVGSGTATGGCGSDVFSGFESFIGSDYADTFTGSATGSETLYGGEGADVFNPTGSASTIRYDNVSEGGDTVNAFSSGVDSFSFSSANFDSGAGFSDGATVDGSTSAYFIFDGTTLSYDADGDGAGAAENIAEVTGDNVIKTDISFF